MAKLILDSISKSYDATPVVNDVSLEIEAGAFVALLGPSGCGKTTVLRSIAGFERIDSGQIVLGEQLLSSFNKHVPPEERQMSMVFQSYALWPHMTVADNVGYALKLKGVRGDAYNRQVSEALDSVNMIDFAKRLPADLSGGQRQRVALARCLASAPKVVLLDEPLANLDQHLRASMEQTFREFHQRTGATFIYVTHDQGEAMALADYVGVINQGKLVQYDTPENLYNQPKTEWVARFIGQGSIVRSAVQSSDVQRELVGDSLQRVMQGLSSSNEEHHSILIRPQHVHVVTEQGIPAVVRERTFKGERYHYQADILGNQRIAFYSEDKMDLGKTIQLVLERGWVLDEA